MWICGFIDPDFGIVAKKDEKMGALDRWTVHLFLTSFI